MTLEARILSLERKVDSLVSLLEYERKQWITSEEAARELGLNITPSKEYTRTLAWLRKHSRLKKFIPGRPYKYDKSEVRAFADDVRAGRKVLP